MKKQTHKLWYWLKPTAGVAVCEKVVTKNNLTKDWRRVRCVECKEKKH